MRIVFGGSWSRRLRYARVADRSRVTPDLRYDRLGLRLARSPVQRMRR